MKNTDDIDDWLSSAGHQLRIDFERARLSRLMADELVKEVMDDFVNGNPRAWWMSLKVETRKEVANSSDDTCALLEILKKNGMLEGEIYFIPERGSKEYLVYKMPAKSVIEALGECPFFEYYLISEDKKILVCENDHSEIITCERRV